MLRRRGWWNAMNMDACPSTTPQPSQRFLRSKTWDEQRHVLLSDYQRMVGLSHVDVVELCARYASNVASGYIQGYLYLIRTVSWVFGRDPIILYWAFVRMVDVVRPFGPLGKEMGMGSRALDVAMQHADSQLDASLLRDLVSVRWGFVLFAQTFVHREHLLCIWDLIVANPMYIGYIMGAILHIFRFETQDLMLRLSQTVDVQVDDLQTTSQIVAIAHLIHNVDVRPEPRTSWSSVFKKHQRQTRFPPRT